MQGEFENLLLDTQKEYSRSNRMKDKIIVVLIVLMFLEAMKGHEKPEVIPKEWYNHTRMDIDDSVLTKFVRSAMKQYREWEEETKKLYEAVCCVLWEKGLVVDYNLMMCYLEDVQHELKRYTDYVRN